MAVQSASGAGGNGLRRELGLVTATALVVANMIGSGIFTTSGIIAERLPGPCWVLLCWLLGGAIAMAGALCFGELATRMPQSGGEYHYLVRLYHPSLGFLTGWTSFVVGFSVPIALSALAFSEYLFAAVSQMPGLVEALPLGIDTAKKVVAVALIAVFTTLHYVGRRLGSVVQNALTLLKFLLFFGILCLGLCTSRGTWGNFSRGLAIDGDGWAFGTSMIIVMFAYSGWNASAYIAGEVKRPRRTLPVSLVCGTAIVVVLYLLINVFIFYAAPYEELSGRVAVFERASTWAFGDWFGSLLGGVIGLATLSSLSAYLMIGPRVYYAMARDGLFFNFAARVHPRYGVPSLAILAQGLLSAAMVVAGSFEQLLVYVGFALGIFPMLAVVGLFRARRLGIGESGAVGAWAYPVVPLFFVLSSAALMVLTFLERPLESGAALVTVFLGVPCYYAWDRKAGKRISSEEQKNIEAIALSQLE